MMKNQKIEDKQPWASPEVTVLDIQTETKQLPPPEPEAS